MKLSRHWLAAFARLCRAEAEAVLRNDAQAWPASQGVGSGLGGLDLVIRVKHLRTTADQVDAQIKKGGLPRGTRL